MTSFSESPGVLGSPVKSEVVKVMGELLLSPLSDVSYGARCSFSLGGGAFGFHKAHTSDLPLLWVECLYLESIKRNKGESIHERGYVY